MLQTPERGVWKHFKTKTQLGWDKSLPLATAPFYDRCPQVGRVKIQVYRGPSKGTGYDAFAPWGYYNTQPVDLGPHH